MTGELAMMSLPLATKGPFFMRALTWWDHGTESIWSQPWGMAIMGPLRGTRLSLMPTGVVPWSVWLAEHPETQVLDLPGYRKRLFNNDFVIGIALGENAKAYPFTATSEVAIVNDQIGEFPVVVLVNAESKAIHAFIRKTASNDLEFALQDGELVDQQTVVEKEMPGGVVPKSKACC